MLYGAEMAAALEVRQTTRFRAIDADNSERRSCGTMSVVPTLDASPTLDPDIDDSVIQSGHVSSKRLEEKNTKFASHFYRTLINHRCFIE